MSSSAKVGDRCPYCGVVWGAENTQRTTTYSNYSKTNTLLQKDNSSSTNNKNQEQSKIVDTSKATKLQTEQWILSKLKTYTPNGQFKSFNIPGLDATDPMLTHGSTKDSITYYFDKYNLIIEYSEKFTNMYNTVKEKNIVSIPIYDIDRVYNYEGDLYITTNEESILKNNITKNEKTTTSVYVTVFQTKSEINLCSRLNNAFFHLKKYYSKPITNEPF